MILTVTVLLLMMSTESSFPSTLRPPRSSRLQAFAVVGVGTWVGTAAVAASVGAATVVGAATGVVGLAEGFVVAVTVAEGIPVWVGAGDGPRVAVGVDVEV